MVVRFLMDYRSRAWMCRYGAGAVVDLDRSDVLAEVLAGGYAVAVEAAPLEAPAVVVADDPVDNHDGQDDGA